MEQPLIEGKKRSALFFKKFAIYPDRLEMKNAFLPAKVIPRTEWKSWCEYRKQMSNANIHWQEFFINTRKGRVNLRSNQWANFEEIKEHIAKELPFDENELKKVMKWYNR